VGRADAEHHVEDSVAPGGGIGLDPAHLVAEAPLIGTAGGGCGKHVVDTDTTDSGVSEQQRLQPFALTAAQVDGTADVGGLSQPISSRSRPGATGSPMGWRRCAMSKI
jgi:hypothetical protein